MMNKTPNNSIEGSKIFIIDDEYINHQTLSALLHKEKCTFEFALNGAEALSKLNDFQPDAILLDLMMPDMNGFEVCKIIKSTPEWQHIPVIIVTALDDKETLKEGFDVGANDFLTKPVNSIELRARVRSMVRIKQQYDDLQAVMKLREDMSNMVAHDMRNPLTTILGYSNIMSRISLPPDDIQTFAGHISREAHRLSSFIDDMLLLAKMEHSHLRLNLTSVNVNTLLETAKMHHQIIADGKQISLTTNLLPESQDITVDKNLFQRVLDNLISNALKYSPGNSTITLKASALTDNTKHSVRIQVIDEGPGVPAEQKTLIFKKFDTGSLNKKDVLQIGLGLAFSKMVVSAHNGTLKVEDNHPVGAIFSIEV